MGDSDLPSNLAGTGRPATVVEPPGCGQGGEVRGTLCDPAGSCRPGQTAQHQREDDRDGDDRQAQYRARPPLLPDPHPAPAPAPGHAHGSPPGSTQARALARARSSPIPGTEEAMPVLTATSTH